MHVLHWVTHGELIVLNYFCTHVCCAAQVFIFSFVSGTALSQLQALLDDPHRIVSLLGVSAPQQASFFSTYILLLVSFDFILCTASDVNCSVSGCIWCTSPRRQSGGGVGNSTA
jgi:hypothetical protein